MASYATSSSTSPARICSKIRCAQTLKECKQVIANVYASRRTRFPEKSVVKSWRRKREGERGERVGLLVAHVLCAWDDLRAFPEEVPQPTCQHGLSMSEQSDCGNAHRGEGPTEAGGGGRDFRYLRGGDARPEEKFDRAIGKAKFDSRC
ncbi:hypothetical protein ISCGN_032937 [Ixodes scapularis]